MDDSEQVLDPLTAYQMVSIMEGVVQRGTATILKQIGKPLAGKTGTTNDAKDAWFVGFSPTSRWASTSATTSRARWATGRPAAASRAPSPWTS